MIAGIVTAALDLLGKLFGAIPFFDKWFTKSTETKVKDADSDLSKEEQDFKNNSEKV